LGSAEDEPSRGQSFDFDLIPVGEGYAELLGANGGLESVLHILQLFQLSFV
jgi:hypothetical protein